MAFLFLPIFCEYTSPGVEVAAILVLDGVDFVVDGVGAQEVLMGDEAADLAFVEDEDAVAVLHAGDALRDDDFREVGEVFPEGALDGGVGGGVAGAGAVVEYEDTGFLQQRPGDAEALLLPTGDIRATLLDAGVVALRHLVDELIGAGHAAGFLALLKGGVGIAPAEVVEDGAGEEHVFLEDDGDGVAKGVEVVLAHVATAYHDTALGDVVETAHEVDERRFAATRSADDADGLARLDVEGDVLYGVFAAARLVGEIDVVEIHAAIGDFRHRVLGVDDVGLLVDDLRHTLAAGRTLSEHDENHAEHHERHEDAHHIGEEGSDLAGGEGSANDELRSKPGDGDDAGIDHQVHHGVVECHQAFGADIEFVKPFGGVQELVVLIVFPDEGFHHPHAGDVLLHAAVELVVTLEDHLEEPRHAADEEIEEDGEDGHRNDEDDAHPHVDDEAHEDAE